MSRYTARPSAVRNPSVFSRAMPSDSSNGRGAQVISAPVSTSVSGSERISPRRRGFSIRIVVRTVLMSDMIVSREWFTSTVSSRPRYQRTPTQTGPVYLVASRMCIRKSTASPAWNPYLLKAVLHPSPGNQTMLSTRRAHAFLLVLATAAPLAAHAQKKPLTQADWDRWQTIASPVLSHDGKWVAYTLNPRVGEGTFIVRATGGTSEYRVSMGYT